MYWEPCGMYHYLEDLIQQSSLLLLTQEDLSKVGKTELVTGLSRLELTLPFTVCLLLLSSHQLQDMVCKEILELQQRCQTDIVMAIDPLVVEKDFLVKAKASGVSRIVVPLDVANKFLFNNYHRVEGDRLWISYWEIIEAAARIFGFQKVTVNLFAGMGETEEEFITIIQKIDDLGAVTSIFSVNENQTLGVRPCTIGKYRRLQMARFLIHNQLTTVRQMQFNQFGSVYEFGIHPRKMEELLKLGTPFYETGKYSSLPSDNMWPGHDNEQGGVRNYCRPLLDNEALQARQELFAINWEEEWKLVTSKMKREGVDFQDIDVSIDFKSLGFIPGITKEDLRYLKLN